MNLHCLPSYVMRVFSPLPRPPLRCIGRRCLRYPYRPPIRTPRYRRWRPYFRTPFRCWHCYGGRGARPGFPTIRHTVRLPCRNPQAACIKLLSDRGLCNSVVQCATYGARGCAFGNAQFFGQLYGRDGGPIRGQLPGVLPTGYPRQGDNVWEVSVLHSYLERMEHARSRGVADIDGEHRQRLSVADGLATLKRKEEDGTKKSVCAHVKVQLQQKVSLAREAFRARLDIRNTGTEIVSNVTVNIRVWRKLGSDNGTTVLDTAPSTELFYIKLESADGFSDGLILPGGTGTLKWLMIPFPEAALRAPQLYEVGGEIGWAEGESVEANLLIGAEIIVHPIPQLLLQYFWQRDVFGDDPFTADLEPSVPFVLGLIVQNFGYAPARDLTITSAQPKIVEDERGLAIAFTLIGLQVDFEELEPSLEINLGTVEARSTRTVRWWMKSTLQGKFISFEAELEHTTEWSAEVPALSALKGVEIFETVSDVRELYPPDLGCPNDMLCNAATLMCVCPGDGAGSGPLRAVGSVEEVPFVDDGRVDFLAAGTATSNSTTNTNCTYVLHSSNTTGDPITNCIPGLEFELAIADVVGVQADGVVFNLDLGEDLGDTAGSWYYIVTTPDPFPRSFELRTMVNSRGIPVPSDNVWRTFKVEHPTDGPAYVEDHLHLFVWEPTRTYTATLVGIQTVANLTVLTVSDTAVSVAWDSPPPPPVADHYILQIGPVLSVNAEVEYVTVSDQLTAEEFTFTGLETDQPCVAVVLMCPSVVCAVSCCFKFRFFLLTPTLASL
jgi:hypothetical protein